MFKKYEKLPEWARWVLLLPLSAALSFSCIIILSLIREDFVFIHSIVAIVSFIIAVHSLAPRWKNQLVVVSLVLRMCVSTAMIGLIFYLGETPDRRSWFELGREVLGWIAGWALYWNVFRKGESIV